MLAEQRMALSFLTQTAHNQTQRHGDSGNEHEESPQAEPKPTAFRCGEE